LVNFTPRPLYQQEKNAVRTEQEAVWAPELVWKVLQKGKKIASPATQLKPGATAAIRYTNCVTLFTSSNTKFTAKLPRDGSR